MTIEPKLWQRAGGHCELCAASTELSSFEVSQHTKAGADTQVLLCRTCHDSVEQPANVASQHWYGLKESIWSEHDAVKVLSYRILKRLNDQPWAQDLLAQVYFDDEVQAWADAGLAGEKEEGRVQVVDSNGTVLQDGDTVTLIKDLDVKGANFTAKRGTTVKGIVLTDDPKYIEGRVNGTRIVLVAAYLKKA